MCLDYDSLRFPETSILKWYGYKNGNNEICNFTAPAKGLWYIDIYGYSAASGITLNVQATPE
jgi:hypothetical protein